MTKDKTPEVTEIPETPTTIVILNDYKCERCGFGYSKAFDFAPFLCYRCMRYIAKRMFVIMNTITPPARTERVDI